MFFSLKKMKKFKEMHKWNIELLLLLVNKWELMTN